MKRLPLRGFSPGQSLVEVAFATMVVSMVLVALLSSIIQSMRNSRVALEQTKSNEYAEETLEWLRQERDAQGWGVFHSALSSVGTNLTYCVATISADLFEMLQAGTGACDEEEVIPDTLYTRELDIDIESATSIRATATVNRPGRSGVITTTLETIFSDTQ